MYDYYKYIIDTSIVIYYNDILLKASFDLNSSFLISEDPCAWIVYIIISMQEVAKEYHE